MGDYEVLDTPGRDRRVLRLNSLNSFTEQRERACEFGDTIIEARVPLAKILAYQSLLPGRLKGEAEYAVIGGVYEITRAVL
jgi:NAD+---dinitrogen-reductase ADP-D-ribosyltransferase